MGYRGRDVEITQLKSGEFIVIACDSAGGIGEKKNDVVKASPEILGALTLKVALLEVLAVGAKPTMMSVAISCEPEPTGRRILDGINQELENSGIRDIKTAISTEKNFETSQTGLGVTIVGVCGEKELRTARSNIGDKVYCIGLPKVGNEILQAMEGEIISVQDIIELLSLEGVHDIIPVGSGGILKEANLMAEIIGGRFSPFAAIEVDLKKSAGPSTCAIFSYEKNKAPLNLKNKFVLPVGEMR